MSDHQLFCSSFKIRHISGALDHGSCHTVIPLGVAVAGFGSQIVGKLCSLPQSWPIITHFYLLISALLSWAPHTLNKDISKQSGFWLTPGTRNSEGYISHRHQWFLHTLCTHTIHTYFLHALFTHTFYTHFSHTLFKHTFQTHSWVFSPIHLSSICRRRDSYRGFHGREFTSSTTRLWDYPPHW